MSDRLPIDAIQNVNLTSSSEANQVTTLEFRRRIRACEPKDRDLEASAIAQILFI